MRIPKLLAPLALLASLTAGAQQPAAQPTAETQPGSQSLGAQAQDVALWVSPTQPADSLILVADNASGLLSFTLDGREFLLSSSEGVVSGVDVQDAVPVAGGVQPLVMAVSQTLNGLVAYVVDPQTRALRRVDPNVVLRATNFAPQSVTLYRHASTGTLYAFSANNVASAPVVVQMELSTQLDGGVGASVARTIPLQSVATGLVADDEQGLLFIAERDRGVLSINADPTVGASLNLVAPVAAGGLQAPVGGLALYRGAGSEGYLVVANPLADAFNVYQRRPPHTQVGTFRVAQDGGVDAVTGPRSLELSSRPLGTLFPRGLLLAHDGANESVENYKLVPWPNVANAFSPSLLIATPPETTDGGTADGGTDGGDVAVPPVGPIGPSLPPDDPSASCNCAAASVPGTVLLVLAGLVLRGRRRRG